MIFKVTMIILTIVYFAIILLTKLYNSKLKHIQTTFFKTKAQVVGTSEGDVIPDFSSKTWYQENDKQYLIYQFYYKNELQSEFSQFKFKDADKLIGERMPVYVNPDNIKKSWTYADVHFRESMLFNIVTNASMCYITLILMNYIIGHILQAI